MTTSVLAQDVVRTLQGSLPAVIFQVYRPRLVVPAGRVLYVFGFVSREVLIGGYDLDPLLVAAELELELLHASLFFDTVWARELPRFYPERVRDLYRAHRAGVRLLRRVA